MINKAIIIGWINKGKPADCGETMKNQLLIRRLEELRIKCYLVDFKGWKKKPWVFLQLVWFLLIYKDSNLIFSTSAKNIYKLMKLMQKIGWKQNIIHWVIGGNLQDCIAEKKYEACVFDYANKTLVESDIMVKRLTEQGIHNVIQVPNFKPINYYPNISERLNKSSNEIIKFVFLSRIMPEKGCSYILEAAKLLNANGYENKFMIDFYGKVAESYTNEFHDCLDNLANVSYKNFLNLKENEGYNKLASYDIMLFPTYWRGEGFAGVFIDAFICGLPMIITDWAHNKSFMKENEMAIYIPVHNVEALYIAMKDCIDRKIDYKSMALNCQSEASKYDVNNVVTDKLLSNIFN